MTFLLQTVKVPFKVFITLNIDLNLKPKNEGLVLAGRSDLGFIRDQDQIGSNKLIEYTLMREVFLACLNEATPLAVS